MLFGPAYKGIPLVATTAMALSDEHGMSICLLPSTARKPRPTARAAILSVRRSPAMWWSLMM